LAARLFFSVSGEEGLSFAPENSKRRSNKRERNNNNNKQRRKLRKLLAGRLRGSVAASWLHRNTSLHSIKIIH